jgi:Tfp pilus assembly protein PilF
MHTHGDAWLALVHGLKLWFVYPPEGPPSNETYARLVLPPASRYFGGEDPLLSGLPEAERPLVCVQHPGETVYLPALWWHATANLGDAVGIGGQNDIDDFVKGESAMAALLAAHPRSGRVHMIHGNEAFRKGDPAAGAAYFQAALAVEAHNFHYRALFGTLLGSAGMPSEAAEVFRTAARLVEEVQAVGQHATEEAAETLCSLAIRAFDLPDYSLALELAEAALALNSAQRTALNRATLATLFLGHRTGTLHLLARQLELATDLADIAYVKQFQEWVEAAPKEPAALVAASQELRKTMHGSGRTRTTGV